MYLLCTFIFMLLQGNFMINCLIYIEEKLRKFNNEGLKSGEIFFGWIFLSINFIKGKWVKRVHWNIIFCTVSLLLYLLKSMKNIVEKQEACLTPNPFDLKIDL